MLYIAYKEDRKWNEKTIHVYSDRSQQEAKKFTEATGNHYYTHNTPVLGVHYTKDVSPYEIERKFKRLKNTEEHKNIELNEEHAHGFKLSGIEYKIIDYKLWTAQREDEVKNRETSNIKALNDAVETFLNSNHAFVHLEKEYTHSSLSVRADFFGVTDVRQVITVEVKSDKDTLTRLEKQLKGYSVFSHIVYVATDIKHSHQVEKMIRERRGLTNTGILIFENGELVEQKKPYICKSIDATKVLWKQEYQNMLWEFDIKGKSSLRITELDKIARNIFTVSEYHKLSEYLFTERYLKSNKLDHVTNFYEDQGHKQKIIERKFGKNGRQNIQTKSLFK